MRRSDLVPHGPVSQGAPPAGDVQAELERILSSPRLQASERRRAFLRFIVEETLAGRAGRLKGYTIATTVFGRDDTFDARADPVVRLEARRLRRDLDSYYVDAGSRDPLRITIPKGSYVPRFEVQEGAQSPIPPAQRRNGSSDPPVAGDGAKLPGDDSADSSPADTSQDTRASSRRRLMAALAGSVIVVVAVVWVFLAQRAPSAPEAYVGEPAVVVLPFTALGASENTRHLAGGITQELIGNLMRFPGFRLYTLPLDLEQKASLGPVKLGRELNVAYVVDGSVRASAEEIRVTTKLFDAASGQVLWSGTYDRPSTPEALIRVQGDLAGEIATTLGQPYGVVRKDLALRAATPAVASMQSYLCVLRAYGYRRGFARENFAPVMACLEAAVRRNPDYSDAWAMLGWLHLDAGRYEYGNMQEEYEKALQAASRAVTLEPDNPLALKALAAIYHYLGRYDDSERLARRAVELNPHDPDTLAQLGWRLAVRGKFDEGIPILKRAIERTVNPPGWYFHLVAIDLYLKEDYEQMLQVAERSAVNGSGVSQALIAIACTELGHADAAHGALDRMSEFRPLARDPAAYFRRHGATGEIVDALMSGLRKAGWGPSGS